MGQPAVALAATALIVVGLSWAVWWLITDDIQARRHRRAAVRLAQRYRAGRAEQGRHGYPAHTLHHAADEDDEDLFDTVPALLVQASHASDGIRLTWLENHLNEAGLVRPYVQDQFPTAILPIVGDLGEQDDAYVARRVLPKSRTIRPWFG